MEKMKKRTRAARMTIMAMLITILIILGYVNIPMPAGLSITFNMIPVAVAAIVMGIPGGAVIGGVFGLISFLQCFGIMGVSAMGIALVNVSPFLMFVQRFVSRVLVGVLAGAIFYALKKSKLPEYIQYAVTGFCAALLNTLFFMGSLVLLFGKTDYMVNAMSGRSAIAFIIASVGINAVIEMIVSAAVTGAVCVALRKAKLI